MIKRIVILISGMSFAILYVVINQPGKPTVPQNTKFIKITKYGKKIDAWSGPWQCVLDRDTDLLWEVKSYREDIYDKQCSFSWAFGERGTPKKGSCFTLDGKSDTSDIVRQANQEKLCATEGWRLPTSKELQSLLIKNPKPDMPFIALEYFPYTQRGNYWTSDSNINLTGIYKKYNKGAISFNFINLKFSSLPYSNTAFVRLVSDQYVIHVQKFSD